MLHIYMHIRYIAEALNVTSYFWHGSVMFNGCVETAVSFGKIENNNSTISRSLLGSLRKMISCDIWSTSKNFVVQSPPCFMRVKNKDDLMNYFVVLWYCAGLWYVVYILQQIFMQRT